ncbi:MAG: sugar transporter substrate-binding protein [Chloroflexi bacterium]|nr:sugar transporter substrate-binding protein [Chloroflexota bacterium]MDB5075451.1 sugar transporter substrate-binding protein [Chloroflexota bacterium]
MSKPTLSRRDALKLGAGTVAALAAVPAPSALASSLGRLGGAKPSQLRILYTTVEADVDAIKLVIPDFKKELGIDLKLDSMPYNALQQKVFAELASSSSYYDIIIVDTPWMPALTHKIQPLTDYVLNKQLSGSLLDLQDFISKVFYDTAVYHPDRSYLHFPSTGTIDPAAIKHAGFDIFGLPIQANALTMSYRKDLFNDSANKAAFKSKFGRPLTVPTTWSEFKQVATFFTRPGQRLFGTTLMAGTGDWATDDFKSLLASWGGDGHLVNDKFQPAFNSAAGVAALTYYADLINTSKVTPPGVTSFSWDEAASTFDAGLTAMSMNYHTEALNSNVKGTLDYAMVPHGVSAGPHFGTWMLSVNPYSKNREWAYQGIVWLTSRTAQSKMLQTQLHPTRHSVYKEALSSPVTSKFGSFYKVLEASLSVGVGRPRLRNYADVDQAVWVAVNNAARGSATPKAALASAASKVTSLLHQAGYK